MHLVQIYTALSIKFMTYRYLALTLILFSFISFIFLDVHQAGMIVLSCFMLWSAFAISSAIIRRRLQDYVDKYDEEIKKGFDSIDQAMQE